MNETPSANEPLLTCSICMKEIPESVAHSAEGEDYVLHFCGATCFEKWEKQTQSDDKQTEK